MVNHQFVYYFFFIVPLTRSLFDGRCHGKNVVYKMAKGKDLLSPATFQWEEYDFLRSNGEMIPQSKSKKLCDLAFSIYDADEGSPLEEEKKAFKGSFGTFFSRK